MAADDRRTHRARRRRSARTDGRLDVILDGVRERVSVTRVGDTVTVRRNGETWRSPPARSDRCGGRGRRCRRPADRADPRQVTQVAAEPGMAVMRGQVLVVLEAMKTVFRLAAPADGIVATVSCQVGDSVVEGQLLVGFAEGIPCLAWMTGVASIGAA